MEILFSIVAILALIIFIFIIIDWTVFTRESKKIKIGLTGKEVEEIINKKLIILDIGSHSYTAVMLSRMAIFKYKLIFIDGKLANKQRF